MGLAALCAFALIGRQHLTLDEANSVGFAQLDLRSIWSAIHYTDAPQALYYMLLHFWFAVGSSVAALRALSALAFVITIPFAYGIARKLYGAEAAVIAGALLAVSSFAVNQAADNMRPYAFALCFSTISTYLFMKAVAKPRLRTLVLYTVSAAAAIYFHLFAGFVIVSHIVSLLVLTELRPRVLRRFALAYAALAILCVPLGLLLLRTGTHQVSWIPRPHPKDVARLFVMLGGSDRVAIFFGLLALAAVIGTLRSGPRGRTLAVLAWLCVPIVAAYGISLVVPLFVPKYLVVIVPAYVLLVARGITLVRTPALVALLAVAAVALSLRLVWTSRHAPAKYDGFPPAAAYLQTHSHATDGVVVIAPGPYFAYRSAVEAMPVGPQAPILYPRAGWKFWLPGQRFGIPTQADLGQRDRIWLILTDLPAVMAGNKAAEAQALVGVRTLEQTFDDFRSAQVVPFSGVSVVELQRCGTWTSAPGTANVDFPITAEALSRDVFSPTCSHPRP